MSLVLLSTPLYGSSGPASYQYTMSGGVSFSGGAAVASRGWEYLPSGGVTFSGTAEVRANPLVTYTGSGGLLFSGSAILSRGWEFLPSGGVQFGGTAIASRGWEFLPSGGIAFSGTAETAYDPLTGRRGPSGGVAYGPGLFY